MGSVAVNTGMKEAAERSTYSLVVSTHEIDCIQCKRGFSYLFKLFFLSKVLTWYDYVIQRII